MAPILEDNSKNDVFDVRLKDKKDWSLKASFPGEIILKLQVEMIIDVPVNTFRL